MDETEIEKILEELDNLFVHARCPNCGFEMLLIITERPSASKEIECPTCGHRTPVIELIKNALWGVG